MVALVTALSAAAEAAGPGAEVRVRLFGWPALAIPVGVLGAALRGRAGARTPHDPLLAILGGLLVLAALARMRIVLGAVVGVG